MHQHTIAQLHQLLTGKEISCVELTQHFLQRIENHSDLNAFITVTAEVALQQAKLADEKIARGEGNVLTGIPILHKDLFCTQGTLTTCGSKILNNFVSPYNATVVQQLQDNGMVMLGKTNMDEFAMGSSNETSYYGAVKNPWDKTRVPGGSSGGSAAAVSARLAPVATATDTGGSIRQPAAFCGLTGIKPSYGRVSRHGMVAFASSLDQGGVLARNAADAALVLQAMSGFDKNDSTSLDLAVENYTTQLQTSLKGKTIGLPKEFFGDGVNNEVLSAVHQAIETFQSLGATTKEITLPNTTAGIPCYYVLAPAEASSNLSRFDGVRYGYRAEDYNDLENMYKKTRTEGFGDEVKRRIMIGTYVLSSGYYDAYYLKAQKLRRKISDEFSVAFKQCDFIIGPTTPTTAFVIGEKNDDPVAMYLNDIFTSSANLAGLPALSMPAGFDKNNLPIGLHLIGNYLQESMLLNAAYQYQQQTDWHTKTPRGYE